MKIEEVKAIFPENWNMPEGFVGYCYVTYCVNTGNFYIGKKQSKKFVPTYYGSGSTVKHWKNKKFTLEHWPISWAHDNMELLNQEYWSVKHAENYIECANIHPGGAPAMLGRHHSEETKQKMREAALKIKHGPMSQETKDRISASNIGKHNKTAEERQAVSDFHKGRKRSAETCKRIGDAKRGENHPLYGKHHDEATRQKISQAQKGRQFTEEHKEKLKQARRAYLEKKRAGLLN